MALSIDDYTIIKVVQAAHHQGDVRYGTSRGIQCSCISLISVSWTLVRSPGQWNTLDLNDILGTEDQLFKSLGKSRYLGIEDLPQGLLIEGIAVNVQFLENKKGEILHKISNITIRKQRCNWHIKNVDTIKIQGIK